MRVKVEDYTWPAGLLRKKLEDCINERVNDGYRFKAFSTVHIPTTSSAIRVTIVFEVVGKGD